MKKSIETPNFLNVINEIISIAKSKEIVHLSIDDEILDGRNISIKDNQMINFGSCSYLGLEIDGRLKEAGIDAIRRYGAQFSCSRTYLSLPLYQRLEDTLEKVFGCPVVLSQSTAVGHQAVIPTLINENDAVILDHQSHYSIQDVVKKLELQGATVLLLRHSRLDELEDKIQKLRLTHNQIWYFADGVYSMYGDFAPIKSLQNLLNIYPQFHLYVDDAHGMSWCGKNGRGYVLSQIDLHPRMILATSLAKGFGSAGGVFLIPDEKMRQKIKNWGGPLTHSGPQQPAVVAASLASAAIHLTDEIYKRQDDLRQKIQFCNEVLNAYEVPVVAESESPIFFVGLGQTKVGYNMVKRLTDDGQYVNLGVFPAVPQNCTGIRFTINCHHTYSDIVKLAERIAYHLPKALKDEGRDLTDIDKAFRSQVKNSKNRIAEKSSQTEPVSVENNSCEPEEFKLQYETSIQNISKDLWNNLFDENGAYDWNGLNFFENVFKDNKLPEDNWDFHYFVIYKGDRPVIATFFTSLLVKDDIFSPPYISEKLEKDRRSNPYLYTSRTLTMGTLLTDGDHLYINRDEPEWKKALSMLMEKITAIREENDINNLYMRDFKENDIEIRDFFMDQGFIKVELMDTHVLDIENISSKEEYIKRLPHKKRWNLKKDILSYEELFEIVTDKEISEREINIMYTMYLSVADKNLTINNFRLPYKLFTSIAASEDWDIIRIYSKNRQGNSMYRYPVAAGFIYKNKNYTPVLLGLDYKFNEKCSVYKQLLYQTVAAGINRNVKKIYLGVTASMEKQKLGAESRKLVVYTQTIDNFNSTAINLITRSTN
jgi:7-keto-8-aminopelargonate synthetase-like enzyme